MQIRLESWTVNAYYPYIPVITRAVETGTPICGIFDEIPAKVPGCVHADLLRAGLIKDPYFEMNALESGWVENYWWIYNTAFSAEPCGRKNARLIFEGIDYEASVTLNGQLLGQHKGMCLPFVADVTELLRYDTDNQLSVVLRSCPDEMGQIGYTSKVHTQKARFTYKWDFSTRLVQTGLYAPVYLNWHGAAAIDSLQVHTHPEGTKGRVELRLEMTAFEDADVEILYQLKKGGEVVAEGRQPCSLKKGARNWSGEFSVENPELWYPNGYGEQPLYELGVKIFDFAGVSDETVRQIGFCKKEYVRATGAPDECLPYGLRINGRDIYIKGVNMVPLDMMYGTVQEKTVEHFLRLARDGGCNLVRVWGGGLIESEAFYNLCDRYGLMVWQEFIQSSSGIDNIPPKGPEFLALLQKVSEHAVKTKQYHVSLAFWCGGNELRDEREVPSTFSDENLSMLKAIVERWDGKTLMLPTSATGDFEFLDIQKPGRNFDVHGPWQYLGPQEHYTVYNASDSQLHSEFGVDGMTNYSALKRFLSEKNLTAQSMANPVWRFHGEMWDTYQRDAELFGPLEPERLRDFVNSSQFIQAEGLRYALEANRRRAFYNVGSIIWQFNEPWPNVSCTNLVDYYGEPKLAYWAMKIGFRPVNPSLRYEKILFSPSETAKCQPFVTSDLPKSKWNLRVVVTDHENKVLYQNSEAVETGDGHTAAGTEFEFAIPTAQSVRILLEAGNGKQIVRNEYLFFVRQETGFADRGEMLAFCARMRELAEAATAAE